MAVAYNNPDVAVAAGYGGPTEGTFITVDGGINCTKLANLRYGPLVVMDDPLSGAIKMEPFARLGRSIHWGKPHNSAS
jgi:hypothetical protein